jgi:outer membrane protein assembly factor BamA
MSAPGLLPNPLGGRLVVLAVVVVQVASAALAAPPDTTDERQSRWAVLPILFSSPDTGFGVGVLPQYVFRTAPDARTSTLRADLYYTQEGQSNVTVRAGMWWPGNRYRLGGKAQVRDWPSTYYGVGNTFADSLRESFVERSAQVSVDLQRLVRPGVFAGVLAAFAHRTIREREAGGVLARSALAGSEGGEVLGAGVFLSFDTRDDVIYPTAGHLVRLDSRAYGRVAGADFGFTQHRLDARQYVRLVGPFVLALHGALRVSTGAPPFQQLHGVGEVVRGYASDRFADRHLLAFRAEVRVVPLVWRFGLAVFAGAGQVASGLGDFALDRFHVAYGAGLRFQIIPSERVNVRWDFGFGDDSSGDYLDLGEAF